MEFEIISFIKIVDMDVIFQMKLTLLKLESQNTKYGRKTKDRSNPGINRTDFWVSEIYEFRHVDGKTGYIHLHKSCRPMF